MPKHNHVNGYFPYDLDSHIPFRHEISDRIPGESEQHITDIIEVDIKPAQRKA